MTFIQRYGLVQYDRAVAARFPRVGLCEWCPPQKTYFDHCHAHGWIRGEVCPSHNGRMKQIDARLRSEWEPWMVQHWLRCPDCAASQPLDLPDVTEIEREKMFHIRHFDLLVKSLLGESA